MTVRIDDFKTALIGGGARANYFRVIPQFPAGVTNTDDTGFGLVQLGSFMIKNAMLPTSTIQPIEVPFRGRMLKVAGDRIFDEMTITIINDNNFAIRNAFENWMNEMNGHVTNLSGSTGTGIDVSSFDTYVQDWTIQQLARDGEVVKEYTLRGAWPTSVSEITLDYAASGDVEEFTVQMAYQYWTSNTTDDIGRS